MSDKLEPTPEEVGHHAGAWDLDFETARHEVRRYKLLDEIAAIRNSWLGPDEKIDRLTAVVEAMLRADEVP